MFPGNRVPENGRAGPCRYLEARAQEHVAQCHAVQDAEGITRFERTRRGCNQRLHLNTATLVTPTVRFPVPNYLMTNNER
jgi:hypothetical protein